MHHAGLEADRRLPVPALQPRSVELNVAACLCNQERRRQRQQAGQSVEVLVLPAWAFLAHDSHKVDVSLGIEFEFQLVIRQRVTCYPTGVSFVAESDRERGRQRAGQGKTCGPPRSDARRFGPYTRAVATDEGSEQDRHVRDGVARSRSQGRIAEKRPFGEQRVSPSGNRLSATAGRAGRGGGRGRRRWRSDRSRHESR